MHVRKLTDKDKALIRKAKRKANDEIRKERKILLARARNLEKQAGSYGRTVELRDLDNKLEQLQYITGNPAQVAVRDNIICLEYGTLAKLGRSLTRSGYQSCVMYVTNTAAGKSLVVEYRAGAIELFEMPSYQVNLLHDLPVIEIA